MLGADVDRLTPGRLASAELSAPVLGPGVPDWEWEEWLRDWDVPVTVTIGRDNGLEQSAGFPHLSIRLSPQEVLIGPMRVTPVSACAGCAEARQQHRHGARAVVGAVPAARAGYPTLVAEIVAATLAEGPPPDGGLIAIAADGTVRRHQVRRSEYCRACAPVPEGIDPSLPPLPLTLSYRTACGPLATRGNQPPFGLDLDRIRKATADPRFGPVTRSRRNGLMPFALSHVLMVGDSPPGQGRATTFREAEVIAYLEAFERSAGYPHSTPLLYGASRRELGSLALDPRLLGTYSAAQYDSPLCKVKPHDDDTPLDWAWARPLDGGTPLLVPADVAFYSHSYPELPSTGGRARNYYLESSSGSALGASPEEAMLHSLLELAERDAFLISWHRAEKLPEIRPATVTDPESRILLNRISDAGYDCHLLVATQDIAVPVVWALLVAREPGLPASFSAAGSNPDPATAVRAALWEVAHCAFAGATWDQPTLERLAADPWQVDELHDHIVRNAATDLLPRVTASLGGPTVALADAFPGWPDTLIGAAGGNVTAALDFVAHLFAQAGLSTILTVDQSSQEHRDLGLSVMRCVVPGIVPMCFGQAQQRLGGLPRLAAAMAAGSGRQEIAGPGGFPFDPHPFP